MYLLWTDRFDAAGNRPCLTSRELLRESFVLCMFFKEHLHRKCPVLIDEIQALVPQVPGIPYNLKHLPLLLSDAENTYSLYRIEKKPYGKPYFTDDLSIFQPKDQQKNPPQFSISHSGRLWGCVFAEQDVGFDLEMEDRGADWDKIAERYFTEEEAQWAARQEGRQAYLKIWTRKEARVKLSGRGLGQGLASFSVLSQKENDEHCYTDISFPQLPFIGSLYHHRQEKLEHIIKMPDLRVLEDPIY